MPHAWLAPDYAELLRERLEGEHFVYNPRTGHTHVLNESGLSLLESIAEQALTAEQLAQRLRLDGAEEDVRALRELLEQQLRQLQLLGLVEPHS